MAVVSPSPAHLPTAPNAPRADGAAAVRDSSEGWLMRRSDKRGRALAWHGASGVPGVFGARSQGGRADLASVWRTPATTSPAHAA